MTPIRSSSCQRDPRIISLLVLVGAVLVALVSARAYAGAWNDGSRLATVECLVDHHTLAIDDSIFLKVPPRDGPSTPGPYDSNDPLLRSGTADRLWING